MISFDTNLLFYALNRDCAEYDSARHFFSSLPNDSGKVAICEFVLVELYVLLRNPAVVKNPLDGAEAAALIQTFRQHPSWMLLDYPPASARAMEKVWRAASQADVGRRVVFDARLAVTLHYYGVTEFATRNENHFQNFGFSRVWNPLAK